MAAQAHRQEAINMAEPFLGEIRNFSFGVVPAGWHLCDGTILEIKKEPALFSLLGNRYGGNGTETFALPDLRGRVQVGMAADFVSGTMDGTETVTLRIGDLPRHNHAFQALDTGGKIASPANAIPAAAPAANKVYAETGELVRLHVNTVSSAGGGAPVPNMQPFLVTNYCIAMTGFFPPRF